MWCMRCASQIQGLEAGASRKGDRAHARPRLPLSSAPPPFGTGPHGRGVLKGLDFFLRTGLRDHPNGPSTANHQPPPTANRQPPTANRQRRPTANRQPLPTTINH